MTIKYENQLKVEDVELNESLKQIVLVLKEQSIFTGNEGTLHGIVLWSRDQNGIENKDVIKGTEELLQEQFGSHIKFSGINADYNDPNEFVVWAKQNKGYVVPLVTVNNKGYLQLGQGGMKASDYGNSVYLTSYEGGNYDPETQRVRAFDALTPEQQEVFKTGVGPGVTSTAKALNYQFQGIVKDIVFVTSNKYEEKDNTKERTRLELKESILTSIKPVPEYQQITQQINALPDDYAYADLIDILGGTSCENLTKLKDEIVVYGVKSLIENTARVTLRGVIVNELNGIVFQSTPAKLKKGLYGFGLQFEFLTGDFTPADLSRVIANLGTMGISTQESLEILTENEIYDPTTNTLTYKTPQDALDVLRLLLGKRQVKLSSFIREKSSKKTVNTALMGAKMVSFENKVSELPRYNGQLNYQYESDMASLSEQTKDIFTDMTPKQQDANNQNPFETPTVEAQNTTMQQNPFDNQNVEMTNTVSNQNPFETPAQAETTPQTQQMNPQMEQQPVQSTAENPNPFGTPSSAPNPFEMPDGQAEQNPWA